MFSGFQEGIIAIYTQIFVLLGTSTINLLFQNVKSVLTAGFLFVLLPLVLVLVLGKLLLLLVVKITSSAAGTGISMAQNNEELDGVFGIAGYDYDPKQDIFYSLVNPWQRQFGYCRLYDEALAPLGMIIDCEPITFECYGKRWMLEFWKGQYALNTGCEIGLYQEVTNLGIPGVLDGPFYKSVSNEDMMHMAFSLNKNGKELFNREDRHWWLNGFKMGEFSKPSELTMDIVIQFNDSEMCYAFVEALIKAGYPEEDIWKVGYRVYFTFDKPHSEQPITRTRFTDWIIQKWNALMCAEYRKTTEDYDNIEDKLEAIKKHKPGIFNKAVIVGKSPKVYKSYDKIANYIN